MRDMTIERHQTPRPPLPARSEEYIDISGSLHVPHARSTDKTARRPGWEPRFVSVNLSDPTRKVVIYRRAS